MKRPFLDQRFSAGPHGRGDCSRIHRGDLTAAVLFARAVCSRVAARRGDQPRAEYRATDHAYGQRYFDRISSRRRVSAMIHHFYVGHFEKAGGAMKLQKRKSDGDSEFRSAKP